MASLALAVVMVLAMNTVVGVCNDCSGEGEVGNEGRHTHHEGEWMSVVVLCK